VCGEPANGALKEGADRLAALGVEQLDVSQTGAVVDADMYELPARPALVAAADAALAGDAMPDAGDPAELFDIDMDQLASPCALIATLGLVGIRARKARRPGRRSSRGTPARAPRRPL
jgi:hypothetical protein